MRLAKNFEAMNRAAIALSYRQKNFSFISNDADKRLRLVALLALNISFT
jgi:hypothetical protein